MIGLAMTGIGLFMAGVGLRTFRVWQREKIEERKIELALEALSLVYESQAVFDHIRSRVIMSGEGTELPPEKGETDERKQQRRPFYAVLERLHASNDYFVRIWKLQPKFIALFGEQAEAIFDLLHNARGEIEITASTVVYQGEPKPDEMREYRTTVFGAIMGAPDPTSEKLENFRKQIDALCRPVIDRTYRADAGKRWWQFW